MSGVSRRRAAGKRRFDGFVHWFLAAACASALWLVLVSSSVSAHELFVGCASVAATAIVVVRVARAMRVRVCLHPKDLAQALRVPLCIGKGVAEVTLVLVRDLAGIAQADNLFRVCRFESSEHDCTLRGRTVLAVALTTMSPNFIVLGVDMARSQMLFHQIKRSAVPDMTKALGARA